MAQPTSSIAYDLAINPTFQRRVKFFMQKAAVAIIGEATPTVPRSDYAARVLSGEASVLEMSIAVVTNGTISAAINLAADDLGIIDTALEFTVNSMWDDFSHDVGDAVV